MTQSGENISRQSYPVFSIYSQVFQEGLVSLTFIRESFYIFAFLLFQFTFSQVSARLSLLLYKFKEEKAKPKKLSKRLSTKATKNYTERACNIWCISALSKENNIGEK